MASEERGESDREGRDGGDGFWSLGGGEVYFILGVERRQWGDQRWLLSSIGVGRRAVAWPPRVLRRAVCKPYAVQAYPSDRHNQQPEEVFTLF
jgi:hypothetical protein